MAENKIGREAVQNPFDMGPNTNYQQPARQMKAFIPLPKDAFARSNQGMEIVDSLLKFAEVGGTVYTAHLNKKIAEDKILQSAQAEMGLAPTDKATVAGYRAHAATIMQDKLTQKQVELNELAKKGLSKEDWTKAVQKAYQDVDSYLGDNYTNYHTDKEMQKLLPLAFREMMPQLRALRQSEELRIMTEKGKNAVTDEILKKHKLLNSNGVAMTPDQLSVMFDQKLKPLRLTWDEKDSIVENVVLLSKDRDMLEAAKQWKGDRKSNLFERSGKLQVLEEQLKNKEVASKGIDFEVAQTELEMKAIQGVITPDEFVSQTKIMRKQSDDTYPHRGFVPTVLEKIYKQRLADADMAASMKAFMDGDTYKLKDKKPKELEGIYDKLATTLQGAAKDEAEKELPNGTEEERAALASKKYIAKNQKLLQRSVEQGYIPKSVLNRVNQIASLNFAEIIKDQERAGGVQEKLDPKIDTELQFLNSIPVAARQAVLDAMDGTKKDVIENYWNERKLGTSEALSMERAQTKATTPTGLKVKEINEAADNIVSDIEFGWPWLFGGKDYPKNQSGLVRKYIADLLTNSSDPMGEATQENIKHAVKSYARTDKGRIFLGMTSDKLYELSHIDISHIDSGLDALIEENMERIKPVLETMGLKQKDVTIMPFPEQGYFRLVDPSGALLSTKRFKFSEIADAANKASFERQKGILAWKKREEDFKKGREKNKK